MIYLLLLAGPVLIILAAKAGLFAGIREIFSRSKRRGPMK